MVLALKEIIDCQDVDIEIYQYFEKQIKSFESKNEDVKNFLKKDAFDFEKRNLSRTFLHFSNDGLLLGYFSLCVKKIDFSKGVSKSLRKNIDGFRKDADSAIVYLIGQLGRDSNNSEQGYGKELLNSALSYLLKAQSLVGMRYCLVETDNSKENEKVISFYENYNFSFLQVDSKDNYRQLILRLGE